MQIPVLLKPLNMQLAEQMQEVVKLLQEDEMTINDIISGRAAVSLLVQKYIMSKYDAISSENLLHADDDSESIESILLEQLTNDFAAA